MSKRVFAASVLGLVVLGLIINTARQQSGLNRFDAEMKPLVDQMLKAAQAAATSEQAVDEFHRQLPTWRKQCEAIQVPASSAYRVKLYKGVKGFFDDFEKYTKANELKAHDQETFKQIVPLMESWQERLAKGNSMDEEHAD